MNQASSLAEVLTRLGVTFSDVNPPGEVLLPRSPVDGLPTQALPIHSQAQLDHMLDVAQAAFRQLRVTPAPVRGEVIRRLGLRLRTHKADLAAIITWESGKIYQEALGEVQEMIDVCDYAVGLSRQLCGLTIKSERPMHRMMEQWHPLGPVGVISAFNFPMAVWAWNATLAIVCGNPVVWKPSPQTPYCALACQELITQAAAELGSAFEHVSQVCVGGAELAEYMADDRRLALISATGSTRMGRAVGERVARRLGRSLLELGGNNALIVTEHANVPLAVRAIVFSAVGTAGQRCTSLRRLFVQQTRLAEVRAALIGAYASLRVGDPFDAQCHVGPLVSPAAADLFIDTLGRAAAQGGAQLCGGREVQAVKGGAYFEPALMLMPQQTDIMHQECFAPLLYIVPYLELDAAIAAHNAVPQGLSSAIFTDNLQEAELFMSPAGSDCGIANVNIGTSGAEIGGAFGGEKDSGGGRESGSDAWKNYMRRATNTINYGPQLPLAQGIQFPEL